jgi:hypothetical protein
MNTLKTSVMLFIIGLFVLMSVNSALAYHYPGCGYSSYGQSYYKSYHGSYGYHSYHHSYHPYSYGYYRPYYYRSSLYYW